MPTIVQVEDDEANRDRCGDDDTKPVEISRLMSKIAALLPEGRS